MRYRTPARTLSGSRPDRRILRTRAILHETLGTLLREKAYDRITVAQILDRAKISRSTFYIHFRDKDDLLTSSMRSLLLGVLSANARAIPDAAERMVAFSLPLLAHIQQHRHSANARLGERGRALLHDHLRRILSDWLVQLMAADRRLPLSQSARPPLGPEILARHIASTFVLALHWWLDQGGGASYAEADKLFRALVMPVLRSAPR